MAQTAEKYADGMNILEVSAKLREARTLSDVVDLIKETYPDWIVGFYEKYCDDYPSLTENWHTICKDAKTNPAQIMIVNGMGFGENYSLIQKFSHVFTSNGFVVRRKQDLIPCSECDAMIPTRFWYERMRTGGKTVPDPWRETCLGCESSSQTSQTEAQTVTDVGEETTGVEEETKC